MVVGDDTLTPISLSSVFGGSKLTQSSLLNNMFAKLDKEKKEGETPGKGHRRTILHCIMIKDE